MSDRRATAFHEAGHAVVAVHLRRAFKYATIVENDESHGHVRFMPPGEWFQPDVTLDGRTRRRIEDSIEISWAGPEAEARHLGVGEASSLDGAEHDLRNITDLASHVCGSSAETEAYIEWLRLRTVQRLRVFPTWPAIELVAARLLDDGRLGYQRVLKLYRRAWVEAAASR